MLQENEPKLPTRIVCAVNFKNQRCCLRTENVHMKSKHTVLPLVRTQQSNAHMNISAWSWRHFSRMQNCDSLYGKRFACGNWPSRTEQRRVSVTEIRLLALPECKPSLINMNSSSQWKRCGIINQINKIMQYRANMIDSAVFSLSVMNATDLKLSNQLGTFVLLALCIVKTIQSHQFDGESWHDTCFLWSMMRTNMNSSKETLLAEFFGQIWLDSLSLPTNYFNTWVTIANKHNIWFFMSFCIPVWIGKFEVF